jgi:hypothetical protein
VVVGTEDQRKRLFESIGVQQKLFDRSNYAEAVRDAAQQGKTPGELLVERGTLSREQLRGLERAVTYRIGRDEDKEIAKIIVDSQYCKPRAVDEALRHQKKFYGQTGELIRIGAFLVKNRSLSESQRVAAYKIRGFEKRSGSAGDRPR